ncbi:MAG: hypothetical protein K6E98_07725 [Lachnospiraceae bacterium]|nr:hypothetical protein [Lachnospiraceae bacterium]
MTVLICFVLTFPLEGIGLRNLAISSAENDELIYYYETSGVVDYGIPQGYFGYTEITARTGPFGAWSPVLLINFCILGKLFGWSLTKAVFYNLISLMLAVFLFGIFARPNKTQTVLLAVFLASYTFLMYGVLSIVPEITCYSYTIIFVGLIYSAFKDNKTYKIIFMFIIAILLTLMRPYYAGFMIAASFFLYRKYGKKSLFCSVPLFIATFYGFFFIGINFCAGNPISGWFSRYIIKVEKNIGNMFMCSGISVTLLSGLGSFVKRLLSGFYLMAQQLKVFFVDRIWGRNYFMFFYIFILLIVTYLRSDSKKRDDAYIRRLFFLVYFFLMTIAVALYFSGWVADRHLAEFVVMGIVFIAMEAGEAYETDNNVKSIYIHPLALALEIGLIFSVIMVPNREREYVTENFTREVEETRELLKKEMPVVPTKGRPSWDNTVLWVYTDTVDGEEVIVPWRSLYAIPSGYAFNLVFKDDWFDEGYKLSSKYIAAASGSNTEDRCIGWGAEKIADYCGVVIYRLR